MTRIHANDGTLMAEYARERRIFVPINVVPKMVIQAFLAAEDRRFYEHGGLDFAGIARAIYKNIQNWGKRRPEGASTITQQVAKNFLLSNKQDLDRKFKEALLAIRIERTFPKEKILELYLNEIYLGIGSYGIAAAALNYFGKELADLKLEEVAYLAALPKAPNNYHPFRKTREATERRNWILDQMAEAGYVPADQARAAKAKPLKVNIRPFGTQIYAADYFAEEVRRRLVEMYGEDGLYGRIERTGGRRRWRQRRPLGPDHARPQPAEGRPPGSHRRPGRLRPGARLAWRGAEDRHRGGLGRAAERHRDSDRPCALEAGGRSAIRPQQGNHRLAPAAGRGRKPGRRAGGRGDSLR